MTISKLFNLPPYPSFCSFFRWYLRFSLMYFSYRLVAEMKRWGYQCRPTSAGVGKLCGNG